MLADIKFTGGNQYKFLFAMDGFLLAGLISPFADLEYLFRWVAILHSVKYSVFEPYSLRNSVGILDGKSKLQTFAYLNFGS